LNIGNSAERLSNFFNSSIELMKVMARACGHSHLNQFSKDDIATFESELAKLSGIEFPGFDSARE